MTVTNRKPKIALGIVAAAIGGCVGYFAFFWIARQRFYPLIVPPALLGLAAGIGVQGRSQPFAIACGIAGLALALFTDWQYEPFIADGSFGYFITHLHELKQITQILLVLGTLFSYRFALGLDRRPKDH